MAKFSIKEIIEATGGKLKGVDKDHDREIVQDFEVEDVKIDSREIKQGDLFIPIIGENFDGHDFVEMAVKNGAKAILSAKKLKGNFGENVYILEVEDTLEALQNIAAYRLKKTGVITVGITGSTGKTTTKDMLHSIFSVKYKTHKTGGNFNNHIGLPLTVLDMPHDSEAIILEMGMDKPGEIHKLVEIARPSGAIITNIGDSHIENLGSRENILKAKLEITDFFGEDNALAIFSDNDMLGDFAHKKGEAQSYKIIECGEKPGSEYLISNIDNRGIDGVSMDISHEGEKVRFNLKVPAIHNCYNACLATALAGRYGIGMEEAAEGLKSLKLTEKRLAVKETKDFKIIDDTYNASPASVKAALAVLRDSPAENKIAVLGDMFELGENSDKMHRDIGEFAADIENLNLITIGEKSLNTYRGARENGLEHVKHFSDREMLKKDIKNLVPKGSLVLVKGSNGMKMNEFIDVLIGE